MKRATFILLVLLNTQCLFAQSVSSPTILELPPIIVYGRADSLLGSADSASQGVVGSEELSQRPILREGEVLETIPGVVITQHSGPGKANQYFLRGFNLDHGTDFATSINGMPVNLPSHAHGQGYTDLNILIPELVGTVRFRKGTYEADQGDFSAAGSADIEYKNTVDKPVFRAEAGSYGYARGLFAGSTHMGSGQLLYAADYNHDDGPWVRPDDANKGNAVLRYSHGDTENGFNFTTMAYKGAWNATDQIAQRAVDEGLVTRFGSLNTSDGGDSQRYSISTQWRQGDEYGNTQVSAYAFYYDLHLFSDFTYFLNDPINGDQIEQQDRRFVSGFHVSHEWDLEIYGCQIANTIGLQLRDDEISNALYNTADRRILLTQEQDTIGQTGIAPYIANKVIWTDWLRSIAGLRSDIYRYNVRSGVNSANSGDISPYIVSPKLSLIFGPWAKTELYLNGGYGFHSNDARAATQYVDTTGAAVSPTTALVRTKGAEVGVRTLALPNLQSTVSFWILDNGSELVWDADSGTTNPAGPSRRYGVEWANYYTPAPWITLDADASLSRARFTDNEPAGNYVPEAIQSVVAAGVALKQGPYAGEIRERYFGPRALTQDNSIRSKASSLVYARVSDDLTSSWNLALEVFNLLNEQADDIEYYYASRLPGEPAAGVNDIHLHPAEPREFRVVLTKRF